MKLVIVMLTSLLLLLVSCKKNKIENEKSSDVLTFFKKTEQKPLKADIEEKYLDTLCQKLQKQHNDSITRNIYFKIAFKFYNLNSLDKYLNLSRKINSLSVKDNDSSHIAKSLYYIGDYYDDKSKLDSAFSYYSQSEKIYKKIKDTLNIGKTTLYKAGILYDAGNFTESEIEAVKALRLLSKIHNTRLVYECYNLIAISLKELNNYKKALEYFGLALKQLEQLERENYSEQKIIKSRISCYNNMGAVYERLKNYQSGIYLYNKGLQTKDLKLNYPKLYAMLLNNLGYSKMKLGINKNIKKLLFESLRIRDSLQILPGIVSSKIKIGEYYLNEKDTVRALNYIKEGYILSKKINSNYDILYSLKLLTENDSKYKTFYSNLYIKVNDSIQNLERRTRNKFARIAYETDQVEEQNEILSKKIVDVFIGSGIIVLLLGGLLLIFRLKSKNQELIFIKEQQESNEKIYQLMLFQHSEQEQARNEERNRISMELHDGIVNSIFTTRFNLMQLDSKAIAKKNQLVNELEKVENEIRKVSHNLQQNLLFEDKTLPEILENLIESQKNVFNTKFYLSIDKYIDWSSITNNNKIHIYRIIQEALQNSNKYSKAEKCCVFIFKTVDTITIRIWDNGIGFNLKKIKQGNGLKNIRERAKAINGMCRFYSNEVKGTTIEIVFK
ncbi:tetratricopeptide repeat-containing sensor histidine kinase [Flavobacterium sp.]|uniref:tetratricopeptide repeat-containing sensor histidine kinase n=1 Tax=Flavobacterium sp. TaxID=239 RepID=UPI0025E39DD0|nr:tetratricopeptide repeat-containing sensor histidine kinase [Flavobacterium sp.]